MNTEKNKKLSAPSSESRVAGSESRVPGSQSPLPGSESAFEDPGSRVPSPDVAISVRNLSKKYKLYDSPQHRLKEALHPFRKKYHRDFWALKDISFEVKKGETVGIFGKNGSGKSTLLQILCGTLTPSEGDITVNGRVAALLELGAGFNPEFTGRENVYMNAAIIGLSREEVDTRFDAIAGFADIGDFIDQQVKTYSSGMYVRLAFAVAINVNPDILVVDEALAVGDIGFQQKCIDRFKLLQEQNITILFVSHDIQMIKNYCLSAIYLKDGNISLFSDPETATEAYLKDMFEEKQKSASDSQVEWKKTTSGKAAFGTNRAGFEGFSLWKGDTRTDSFHYGDTISLKVAAWLSNDIANPSIWIQLRDQRGYVIYGTDTLSSGLAFPISERELGVINGEFDIDLILAPGAYSIVVSLLDHLSDNTVVVHEKVIGALNFTVFEGRKKFHGAVDLNARCKKTKVGNDFKHTKWGEHDIGEEALRTALKLSNYPSLLTALVQLSRSMFGWFSETPSRPFEYPWMVHQIGEPVDKRILDIGAGVSPLPLFLAGRGAKVTTIDNSPVNREPGNGAEHWNEWGFLNYKDLNEGITSIHDDILAVEFPRGTFDCIYSVSVIEHMPASVRIKVWERVSRWLKEDGLLLLTIDLIPKTDLLWNYSEGEEVDINEMHGNFEKLREELFQTGFKLMKQETLRDLPSSRVDCMLLRFERR